MTENTNTPDKPEPPDTPDTPGTPETPDTPDLKTIIGAMLFAARKPLPITEIRRVLRQVSAMAEDGKGAPTERQVRTAMESIGNELAERKMGLILAEVAGGFRLLTDPVCGAWVRCLLDMGKPSRLSHPALETLAIIAYRQPVCRAEIEGVRGVGVDAMLRTLLEMQLIKITGRSELPGRPMLYGTTQLFLEHFGLSNVRELPGVEQLCRREAERAGNGTGEGAAVAENQDKIK